MLITFKSEASGDVMMFSDVAAQLLGIIGKSLEQRGVITVEQLPDAIARLKQAATANKAQLAKLQEPEQEKSSAGGQRPFVSMAVRAVPFIELLERSLKAKKPVMWGV
jgi:uncharacterized protein DUF1840